MAVRFEIPAGGREYTDDRPIAAGLLQRFLLGDRVRLDSFQAEDQGWYVAGVQYAPMNTLDVVRYSLAVDLPTGTADCGMFGDRELTLVERPCGFAHEREAGQDCQQAP